MSRPEQQRSSRMVVCPEGVWKVGRFIRFASGLRCLEYSPIFFEFQSNRMVLRPTFGFRAGNADFAVESFDIRPLSHPHRLDESRYSDDVHDPGHIVGKDMQCHFSGDVFQTPHLEVGITHPGFDRAERMFDRH